MRHHKGEFSLELIAACLLLAVGITLIAQFLVLRNQAYARLLAREAARLTADGGLELLQTIPFAELEAQQAQQLLREQLPVAEGASIEVEIVDQPGTPAAKRIQVRVSVPDAPQPLPPVTLTAWRFQPLNSPPSVTEP